VQIIGDKRRQFHFKTTRAKFKTLIRRQKKNSLMQIASFRQVPYIFSKSKSQDTKINLQKIPDAIRPKEDKILSAQIQRMVSRQVQKRFLTSFKVTNSDKIPDKFTFGKSRQISSDKIPDKFTFRQKSRQTPSDFHKISLFKLPRLQFKCPS
jgi:hypothetical protein